MEELRDQEDTELEAGDATSSAEEAPKVGVFRNRFGHWRAVWRMLLYSATAALLLVVVSVAVYRSGLGDPGAPFISWSGSLSWLCGNAALIGAAVLLLKFFDRRPAALLGFGFGARWFRELWLGVASGLAATTVLAAILVMTRSIQLELTDSLEGALSALPLLVFTFTVAALLEELLFRGYLLQALAEGSRPWIAGLLTTALFTWAHADNPDVTAIGVINIFLAGVILCVLYFRTRRLWLALGFHFSWNFCQSWLWGFDVSGIKISDQLFLMTPTDADLVTGGEFGLEGSILLTLLFGAWVGWMAWKKRPRAAEETEALWAPYPTGFGREAAPARAEANSDSAGVLNQ